ncbi:MAG: LytTR family DNA-binding domain-containing protein [Bacteroidota bacterium]
MANRLKCIIVDDEEMATRVIESHLEMVDDIDIIGIYHSGVEAFHALDKTRVDVMFLDIQMPKLTGISMLKMLKHKPLTVLTTAHRDYAIQGFDLDVVDYLLKPISLERFLQTISKIRRLSSGAVVEESSEGYLFIKANREYHKVFFNDILSVEAIKNHIRIRLSDKSLISLMTLSEFESKVPEDKFARVHRSYLVNLKAVNSYSSQSLDVHGQRIPIGRSYKDVVRWIN